MLTIGDFYQAIDSFAPFSSAESWDNVGILVGSKNDVVTKVLLALDVTSEVIKEAVSLGANLIITHHPLIFTSISSISSDSLVYQLIKNDIGLISAHTNLDMAPHGVNIALAGRLGLTELNQLHITEKNPYFKISVFVPETHVEQVYDAMAKAGAGMQGNYTGCGFFTQGEGRFLPLEDSNPTIGRQNFLEKVPETRLEMIVSPKKKEFVLSALRNVHPYEEPAFDVVETTGLQETFALGLVGILPKPMTSREFAQMVKENLNAPSVRYLDNQTVIKKVALCSGSGGDFLQDALRVGADAYVTGEIQHHNILIGAEQGITIVEAGHFATENPFMEPLQEVLLEKLPSSQIYLSQSCTDGLKSV